MSAMRTLGAILALSLTWTPPAPAAAPVTVEYVGHACFGIESSAGTRIVIDPFNSHIWIGYEFPEPPPADGAPRRQAGRPARR